MPKSKKLKKKKQYIKLDCYGLPNGKTIVGKISVGTLANDYNEVQMWDNWK